MAVLCVVHLMTSCPTPFTTAFVDVCNDAGMFWRNCSSDVSLLRMGQLEPMGTAMELTTDR